MGETWTHPGNHSVENTPAAVYACPAMRRVSGLSNEDGEPWGKWGGEQLGEESFLEEEGEAWLWPVGDDSAAKEAESGVRWPAHCGKMKLLPRNWSLAPSPPPLAGAQEEEPLIVAVRAQHGIFRAMSTRITLLMHNSALPFSA